MSTLPTVALAPETARAVPGRLRVRAETFSFARDAQTPSEDAAFTKEFSGVFLAAVADGLGAAKQGGEAATRVIQALARNFPARPRGWSAGKTLQEITRHLNRRLYQEGLARFASTELATTIAALALEGDRVYGLNAGDSRIYLWRGGRLTQLSIDHREPHPGRTHVLTQAMGLAEELVPAVYELPLLFVLQAEQFLLRHDFVHGDLKPENILVLRENEDLRFKIIDLGSVSEIFSLQGRAGTPSYLAPERFTGGAITERTEIFSLGATLYEALAGRMPYGEIEPFQTPAFRAPRPLAVLNPHVPPWLESIVARALAAAPDERYESYSEMLFDLENPSRVRQFYPPGTPLLERHPLLFYKIGFFGLLATTLGLLLVIAHLTHP